MFVWFQGMKRQSVNDVRSSNTDGSMETIVTKQEKDPLIPIAILIAIAVIILLIWQAMTFVPTTGVL